MHPVLTLTSILFTVLVAMAECPNKCVCETVIDCRSKNLKSVPKIGSDISLKKYNLIENEIAVIRNNDFYSNSSFLIKLYLNRNRISVIETDAFRGLQNLESLDLSNNSIRTLRKDVFAPLRSLEYLSLSYNPLTSISGESLMVPPLRGLFLNYCNITNLDDVFRPQSERDTSWLNSLSTVLVTNSNVRYVSKNVVDMIAGVDIDLRGNNLECSEDNEKFLQQRNISCISLNSTVHALTAATTASVAPIKESCSLGFVGEDRRTIRSVHAGMTELNWNDRGLEDIAQCSLRHLTALRKIDLSGNKLRTLPADTFLGNGKLEWLSLAGNPLTAIDAVALALAPLRFLNLSGCPIKQFPVDGQWASKLEVLDLSLTNIWRLPDEAFSMLRSLRVLNQTVDEDCRTEAQRVVGLKAGMELIECSVVQSGGCNITGFVIKHSIFPISKSWKLVIISVEISSIFICVTIGAIVFRRRRQCPERHVYETIRGERSCLNSCLCRET